MGVGDWQTIVDHNLPPATVEVKTNDVLAVGRQDRPSQILVEWVKLVLEDLQ